MDWQPLIDAGPVVQLHAGGALVALVLGGIVLWRRKGGTAHRALGRAFVAAMLATAASALWINDIRLVGPFSPLHVFSVVVAVNMALAVLAARDGRIDKHRTIMRGTYLGALVVPGLFALMPDRTLWTVVTGGGMADAVPPWLRSYGWTLPLAVGIAALIVRRPGRGGGPAAPGRSA